MARYRIVQGNETMYMHEDGCIERPSVPEPYRGPSDTWRVVGAVRRNNFGYVVERYSLEDIKAGRIRWKHANGAQRVFVLDVDHGTLRQWSSGEIFGRTLRPVEG